MSPPQASAPTRTRVRTFPPIYPPHIRATADCLDSDSVSFPERLNMGVSRSSGTASTAMERWAIALAAAIIDVSAGRRDIRALRRWIAPDIYRRLSQHIEASHAPGAGSYAAVPHSARSWRVHDGAEEVAVTLWDRGRLRAVALRVEYTRGRYLATALEMG